MKEASIEANKIWKAVGKPRRRPIFSDRQLHRLRYRKRIKEHQKLENEIYIQVTYTKLSYRKVAPVSGAAGARNMSSKTDVTRLKIVLMLTLLLTSLLLIS